MEMIPLEALPLIGIVTVLFNSEAVLPGFFESLAKQEGIRYKLYVIDNSPKDGGTLLSRELAARYGIDAIVHFNNANGGVAKGNNQGIALARADHCDYILLANNDTEFGSQTIRLLQDALVKDGESVATPKIMYYDKPNVIWYAGGHLNLWLARTLHHGQNERDSTYYATRCHVEYAPTCFLMLESGIFDLVGRMDEHFFVYYDDTDFMWRLKQKHVQTVFVPNARVYHKVSSSTGGSLSTFSIYYGNRNRILFVKKHIHGMRRFTALSYIFLGRIYYLTTCDRVTKTAIMRGIIHGLRSET
ncbi:MAG: glycosyltransferase family 2 protein [Nevskiaceae bacterium]|nr:MAG: glycosyltransferase family 2 protein [Nevskiaceae bacterium]TBR74860.1 MAG: glycosyltransferase family 2 protein [Nevskiaceae bacterium]